MAAIRLTFLGGVSAVTGPKYLIDLDTALGLRRILIDCGMFQGQKKLHLLNWSRFPTLPSPISDIFLTHAYIDHMGYLPRLAREGFNGMVWGTDSTLALTEIILRDSAFLQERDADFANVYGFSRHANAQPLYRIRDAERTLPMFRTIEFARPLDLGDGMEVT